jgi:hypothetical protein
VISIEADALIDVGEFFGEQPELARTAARLAINTVAERSGRKLLRDEIVRQVAFPAGYVNNERLSLRKAYNENLEAVLTARQRPTSLARFARAGSVANRAGGVAVAVKPGKVRRMPSAFLIRLRAGATLSDENFNLGLAIRLKPGDRIINKREQAAVQLGHNLYLLYGPSVDQVFRDVAADKAPEIAEKVGDEFLRQYTRLNEERS